MKPVNQTRDGATGNCLQACIASLLDLPLDAVPDFGTAAGQWLRFARYMNQHGLQPVDVTPVAHPYNAYYLVTGTSPRGVNHACVALNGRIVHDPHPSDAGLQIERLVLFVAFVAEK